MIREIKVRTALSLSKLPGLDYALNPYRGCAHACVYCYAPSLLRWDKGNWGDVVEAKINLPRVLSRELRTARKGVIGLGTVTDPYQPGERTHEITRRCLELLLRHDYPVCIQTKSSLVLRDMDLLKRFSHIEVGVTLTALDESMRQKLEPGASSVQERLQTLLELSRHEIHSWVFLGPVMPYLIDEDIGPLLDTIAAVNPEYVLVDRLRMKEGMWERIKEFILHYDPILLPGYEKICRGDGAYYREVFENIVGMCAERGLTCEKNRLGK